MTLALNNHEGCYAIKQRNQTYIITHAHFMLDRKKPNQTILVASVALWPNSNLSMIFWIRLHCMFFCANYKSFMDWIDVQHVAVTTMTLPTTASTFHNMNCFGQMI